MATVWGLISRPLNILVTLFWTVEVLFSQQVTKNWIQNSTATTITAAATVTAAASVTVAAAATTAAYYYYSVIVLLIALLSVYITF